MTLDSQTRAEVSLQNLQESIVSIACECHKLVLVICPLSLGNGWQSVCSVVITLCQDKPQLLHCGQAWRSS